MRELRRADQRFRTEGDGTTTFHSFSYGAHYDAGNISFGPIVAINTEHIEPGAGYDAHRHSDVEIVTWVLDGLLAHEDSTGAGGEIPPGLAQRLSAGAGVSHTERNASDTEGLTFVQMMLRSENEGDPEYAQVEVGAVIAGVYRSVDVHAPAELRVAVLAAGDVVEVPAAPRTLLHVTRGRLRLGEDLLGPGDELRTDELVGTLTADEPSEALIWLLR
ncbi:pirin family protein [Aeromicrobium phragmitis]|uniref:Pirin family protein n=1 Tax=Aeromicrobium phragmitis TaxID=2478914 RepID=A0A3L8PIK5_9ACTN|nr:pirin family protein [Aeromicrobium phragmitis]RLV55000.1 pirin family protein [Aeromicrobium phragmitis]